MFKKVFIVLSMVIIFLGICNESYATFPDPPNDAVAIEMTDSSNNSAKVYIWNDDSNVYYIKILPGDFSFSIYPNKISYYGKIDSAWLFLAVYDEDGSEIKYTKITKPTTYYLKNVSPVERSYINPSEVTKLRFENSGNTYLYYLYPNDFYTGRRIGFP